MLIYASASTADNTALHYGLRPCPSGHCSLRSHCRICGERCVKTHVCMKNKPYTSFKPNNKVKNLLNFGFSHSLALMKS